MAAIGSVVAELLSAVAEVTAETGPVLALASMADEVAVGTK